jgi:hypothetical protein
MGHVADVCQSTSHDDSGSYDGGDSEVKVTGRDVGHWRTAPATWDQDPKRHKSRGGSLPAREPSGSCQPDWT